MFFCFCFFFFDLQREVMKAVVERQSHSHIQVLLLAADAIVSSVIKSRQLGDIKKILHVLVASGTMALLHAQVASVLTDLVKCVA
jgi:hypothetical protein